MALAAMSVSALEEYSARVVVFGDNRSYATITSAIRHWDFGSLQLYHFWGLPYAAAFVGSLTGLPSYAALVVVSLLSSVTAVLLVHTLWGGTVAVLFAVTSSDWIQRSILGGAEPLFCALLFGSVKAARSERWILAAFLAALSTTVRPVGALMVIALLGAGATRLDWRTTVAVAIAAGSAAILYVLPLVLYFPDPGGSISHYNANDWLGEGPLGFPFVALVRAAINYSEHVANTIQIGAWVALVLAGLGTVVLRNEVRSRVLTNRTELIFAALYLAFLLSYNSRWGWLEFPRFAIPLLPWVFFALSRRWSPPTAWLVAAAFAGGIFAGVSAVGVRPVLRLILS